KEYSSHFQTSWLGVSRVPGASRVKIDRDTKKLIEPVYEVIMPMPAGLHTNAQGKRIARRERVVEHKFGGLSEITPLVDVRSALQHSRAAVVASGTATVEAALANCPFVCVYKLSPLTYRLARKMVKVPYACMVNLIAGREIVPELLQKDFTPKNVAKELEKILREGPEREAQLAGFAEVRARLQAGSDGR